MKGVYILSNYSHKEADSDTDRQFLENEYVPKRFFGGRTSFTIKVSDFDTRIQR